MAPLRSLPIAFAALFLAAAPRIYAQAALVSSVPAADSSVDGRTVEISLKFDRKVDAVKSGVDLEGPEGGVSHLTRQPSSAPENLEFLAQRLSRGAYQLSWSAVDESGQKTSGLILFRVK